MVRYNQMLEEQVNELLIKEFEFQEILEKTLFKKGKYDNILLNYINLNNGGEKNE